MLRRESKQRKAEVDAERLAKTQAATERDNMCEAIWTMCLVHKDSFQKTMAESRTFGARKRAWLREQAEAEATELAASALAPKMGDEDGVVPGGHWGESGMSSPLVDFEEAGMVVVLEGEEEKEESEDEASPPSSQEQQQATDPVPTETVVRKPRGKWEVAPASSPARPTSSGGGRHGGGGGGGGSASILGKRKPESSGGGLSFGLKRQNTKNKKKNAPPPPLPAVMVKAAEIAVAEEERLMVQAVARQKTAAAAATTAAAAESICEGNAQEAAGEGGKKMGQQGTQADAINVEYSVFNRGRASAAAGDKVVDGGKGDASAAVDVSRLVKVSVSKPLLASIGADAVGSRVGSINLWRAMCNDPRLIDMRWPGGLVMIKAVVKDAPGGQGLPGIEMTQGPTQLVIEALGSTLTISSSPELAGNDGFAAACSDGGVNCVRNLKANLHRLSVHVEEHARGGDESLRWVNNLREKRLVLEQVGEILEDEDYHFSPALGGIWMAVFHHPNVPRDPTKEWNTGSATPTIEIRVLMRRARLATHRGVTVEQNIEYFKKANDGLSGAVAAAASAVEEEKDDGEEEEGVPAAEDIFTALADQVHDGHVREVVSGVLDGVVQQIMLDGGKAADLREVVMWRANESKRLRLMDRGVENPRTRKFSFVSDSESGSEEEEEEREEAA